MALRARSWWLPQARVLVILVVAAAGLAALRADYRALAGVSMSVIPEAALVDEPVTVSVRGLTAGARATVTATAVDDGGRTWSASALFEATSAGEVSLHQPSLGGSYSGVNPMGLFQFMTPTSAHGQGMFRTPDSGFDVTLAIAVGRRVAATATARRQGAAEVGVVTRQLRPAEGGIHGTLYLAKNTFGERPAVLLFGGSEGGVERTLDASLLAARGFTSLALAYFGVPGLPRRLADIPLEYFVSALAVLRTQPGVDPDHVLVMANSRGTEAALLLGAHFPGLVDGVIAGAPSSVVHLGSPDASRPAWTLRGRPLPAVTPAQLGTPSAAVAPAAVIPVERIRGPIFLVCGGLDAVWSSCPYTYDITDRLGARRFPYPVIALHYPNAGHLAGGLTAYVSITAAALTRFGGALVDTQSSLVDGHAKLLSFLASQ